MLLALGMGSRQMFQERTPVLFARASHRRQRGAGRDPGVRLALDLLIERVHLPTTAQGRPYPSFTHPAFVPPAGTEHIRPEDTKEVDYGLLLPPVPGSLARLSIDNRVLTIDAFITLAGQPLGALA